MKKTFVQWLVLAILFGFPSKVLSQDIRASVKISCSGRDTLNTELILRKAAGPTRRQSRYLGFFGGPGEQQKLTYDIAFEMEVRGRFGAVRVCGISLYTTDGDQNRRAAFWGGVSGGACVAVSPKAAFALGVQAPKAPPGQFNVVDECEFSEFVVSDS